MTRNVKVPTVRFFCRALYISCAVWYGEVICDFIEK